jgi:glutamine synthetase
MSGADDLSSLLDTIRASGVRQVRVVFVDYNGIARARSVQVEHLDRALQRGVNFSSPTVEFNSNNEFPPDAAFDLASADFWALPDPATYVPAPGTDGAGQMLADLVDARGGPWAGCPRTALRRMDERAQEAGLAFQVGFEPEGYVFRPRDTEVDFVGASQFATLDGLDLEPAFIDDLLAYLREAGLDVEQWSEEFGPGQIEVNLRHGNPLPTADCMVTYKHAFRSIARRHGLLGTFMPKPFGAVAGSGLHVHLSATRPDDPSINLFDDPAAEFFLSALARQALAGILAHGEALTALGASTVNSYKRFIPGSWAPTHIMYAYASRAAFVRIPERETARRLELRAGDAAGSPYLYLAGILAAMLDGIERELDPGLPMPGDVGTHPPDGARAVPPSLDRALEYLATDNVLCAALGTPIVDEFIKIKRTEWKAFAGHVGPWDREWYLYRY